MHGPLGVRNARVKGRRSLWRPFWRHSGHSGAQQLPTAACLDDLHPSLLPLKQTGVIWARGCSGDHFTSSHYILSTFHYILSTTSSFSSRAVRIMVSLMLHQDPCSASCSTSWSGSIIHITLQHTGLCPSKRPGALFALELMIILRCQC